MGTPIGLLYIFLALGYFVVGIFAIALGVSDRSTPSLWKRGLYLVQRLFVSILLFLLGAILLWSGWRLDPSLEFAQTLQAIALIYLSLKDAFVNFSR